MARRGVLVLVAVVAALAGCTPPTTPPPEVPTVAPAANPDLVGRCGLDVNLVLDRSSSIGSLTTVVEAAAQGFVDALAGTGSRVRTVSFANLATAHPFGGAGVTALDALTWSSADDYDVPSLTAGGGTNVDDGLEVARRAPGPQAQLTVLFTDGQPNGHLGTSPDGHPGPYVNRGHSRDEAIVEANLLKGQGSHLFAIGVGSVDEAVLAELTGPDALGPGVPITAADYAQASSLAELGGSFRKLASQLCAPALSLTKIVTEVDGSSHPAPGWQFAVTGDPEPTWTQPPGGPGALTTGPDGNAVTTWIPGPSPVSLTVAEVLQPGFLFRRVSCTIDHHDGAGPQPLTVTSTMPFTVDVPPDASVHCTVVNAATTPPPGSGGDLVVVLPTPPKEGEHPGATVELRTKDGVPVESRSVAVGGRTAWAGLTPGAWSIRVQPPVGWHATAISCGGAPGDVGAVTADATVSDGATVGCRADLERLSPYVP